MKDRTPALRRGRIDELYDFATMDLIAFNDGVAPFSKQYMEQGFRSGVDFFRSTVAEWGFEALGNIADVCSGFGRWSLFLAETNASVVGVEIDKSAVELSRKLAQYCLLSNLIFEVADACAVPAPDESLDGLWHNNSLQFVRRSKFLIEAHRILKSGSPLFVGQYNGLRRLFELFLVGFERGGLNDNHVKFALNSLKQGPLFDGLGTYASAEHLGEILRTHGFVRDPDYPVRVHQPAKGVRNYPFARDLLDLEALGRRLESDPEFTERFVRHPEVVDTVPDALSFRALKV